MTTIWKFPFKTSDDVKIDMPFGAEIMSVHEQNNEGCLWTLVESENSLYTRYFKVFGTGHEMSEAVLRNCEFIGTYFLNNGQLVFHIFEHKT